MNGAIAIALSACGGEATNDEVATPSSFEQCNHPPRPRGDLPSLGGVALHWTDAQHGFDEPGGLFGCLKAGWTGAVKVSAPDGVEVTPTSQSIPGSGTGVVRFDVRVEPGSSGRLYASVTIGAGGRAWSRIVTTDDGWSLREPE